MGEENVVRQEEVLGEESVVREEDVLAEDNVVVEEEEVAANNVVVEEEEVVADNVVVEEEVVAQQNAVAKEEVVVEDVNCDDEEGLAGEKLDDSEEERVVDDDGFGMDIDPLVWKIGPILDRWKSFKRNSSKVRRKGDIGEGAFVINEEVGVHDINEDYNTDDLDSDVDSDEGAGTVGPKFCKFRPEDMNKEFKFKLGMEFGSLKDFKQALMKHSVLNGKEVKFVKNDQKRVRAICKKKCGFVIMASRVGGRETYRVKTLIERHKCGRVFGNKNANKDWIAQVLIDRFMNVGIMTVAQIIDEVKKTYSVGITPWRAGKAKQIAMDCLVGDGQ